MANSMFTWPLVPFSAFTMSPPVLPSFYWDVESQEQRIKAICENMHKLGTYDDTLVDAINANHGDIVDLQEDFQKFQDSGFNDYYQQQVDEWIDANLDYIFTHTAKQVFFGLNLEGYFVAYIPQSWDEIVFDTGHVYNEDTYGRLILRWEVPASNTETVNQTPEIVR